MVPVLLGLLVVGAIASLVTVVQRRPERPPVIDAFTLGEPWRRHVAAAQTAQRRYREIAAGTPPGPLRDRLGDIELQVQRAVQECFGIARSGDDLDDALSRFNSASLTTQLAGTDDDITRASLQSQLDSAARIRSRRDDTDGRLRLLTTRMGELVAQAAEVSVGTDSTESLGTGVDDVVTQMEALRLALAEMNGNGGTGPPTTSS